MENLEFASYKLWKNDLVDEKIVSCLMKSSFA